MRCAQCALHGTNARYGATTLHDAAKTTASGRASAITPAAWRYSPRSAAPHPYISAASLRRARLLQRGHVKSVINHRGMLLIWIGSASSQAVVHSYGRRGLVRDVGKSSTVSHALASLVRVASSYRPQSSGTTASSVVPVCRTEMDFGQDQRSGTTLGLSEASGLTKINPQGVQDCGITPAPWRYSPQSAAPKLPCDRKATLLEYFISIKIESFAATK